MRFTIKTIIGAAALLIAVGARAEAKLRVVASIEALADLSKQVGGDRVDVTPLSRGYQEPHFVEAKPSLVLTLNRADALVDIHPLGNPHYWIPPANARAIAHLLADRFAALDPGGAATYKAELARFEAQLSAKEKQWAASAASLKGTRVVTYHKSWSYVARWLGLEEVGYIEPRPGIPPTASHTAQLIELMKKSGVKLVIVDSFYPSTTARFVADNAHARLVAAPSNVGATPAIKTYFDLVDAVIAALKGG